METGNKAKLMTIVLTFLLVVSITVMVIPLYAQNNENVPHAGGTTPTSEPPPGSSIQVPAGVTPDITFGETQAFLSFRPNPIGLGQPLLVNIWVTPPPTNSRVLRGYKITLTKPDGSTDVVTLPYSYEADGTNWFEYNVDQVGEWSLKFEFPGTYFPAGNYIAEGGSAGGNFYPDSQYYEPASTGEQSLTVQEDLVASWPPAELPHYWERPISPYNREWYSVAGPYPWPWTNWARDWMGPWITAPKSAHIAWLAQHDVGGIMGGTAYTDSSPTSNTYPTCIYMGRAYQTYDKQGVGSVAACFDIRTGEVFYEIPVADGGVTPDTVVYNADNNRYELIGGTYGSAIGRGGVRTITGDTLFKVDPWTGEVTDIPIMPLDDGLFHNGAFVLSTQRLSDGTRRLINWTVIGNSANFASRVISNITWELDDGLANYAKVEFDKGVSIEVVRFTSGNVAGGYIYGMNLKTGKLMWNNTLAGETAFHSGVTPFSDDGSKIAVCMEHNYFNCYDTLSGQLVWKSELTPYPWGDFWNYDAASLGDKFYAGNYVGMVAFNWADGSIAWLHEAPSIPFETPYVDGEGKSVYSWHSATIIADGMLLSYTDEHSETQPLTRGWRFYALDLEDGHEIWSMGGYNGDARTYGGSCSDGYLMVADEYTGRTIGFGPSKSETAVIAPDYEVAAGSSILIKGTVLDLAPAQPGTPCVSKDSMRLQMEYLHMAQPIDGIWHNETITGVPVSVIAIDANGGVTDIGTTTTNGYYGTFALPWTPDEEGTYEIIATFAGDESYGSSAASDSVLVGPAPSGEEPPVEEPVHPIISTEAAIIIGVVVIAAIAIIAYVVMRRPKK